MLKLFIVLFLSTAVLSESQVRETETWMPMKTTQKASMSSHEDMEASGDSHNGSDFGFSDDEDDDDVSDPYDEEFSGSGDGEPTDPPKPEGRPSEKPFVNDNKIPDLERPVRPTVDEKEIIKKSNEIPGHRTKTEPGEDHPSNVLMSHATEDSIFNKTEVLAALIAGGAVGLMFAVLLILLLIYRMKKKDEGSYVVGNKPIYKKAPTTEIYA
ncbi:syndecan-4 isoform X1 [Periophthalmus magnuspinnatus]|uniref:syndecan-4 isoform X1 n=1 Tax=Periophthalmus magnuspinnatus TaxID=409849 RepID=UPI00145BFAF2|nr:syndecan-4 isoform X1 [Periophthalmus magnuspinnatus]